MSFKTITVESKPVTEEIITLWTETTLPTIISRYLLENVFNADEFGLLYNVCQTIPYILREINAQKGSIIKFVSPDGLLEMS